MPSLWLEGSFLCSVFVCLCGMFEPLNSQWWRHEPSPDLRQLVEQIFSLPGWARVFPHWCVASAWAYVHNWVQWVQTWLSYWCQLSANSVMDSFITQSLWLGCTVTHGICTIFLMALSEAPSVWGWNTVDINELRPIGASVSCLNVL